MTRMTRMTRITEGAVNKYYDGRPRRHLMIGFGYFILSVLSVSSVVETFCGWSRERFNSSRAPCRRYPRKRLFIAIVRG